LQKPVAVKKMILFRLVLNGRKETQMSRLNWALKDVRLNFRCERSWMVEALVLLVVIFFAGCGGVRRSTSAGRSGKEAGLTTVEQRKAILMRRIERKFENPDAHFELGKLYQADGMWEKADYEYSIVLGLMPNHRGAQAAFVKMMLERGETKKSAVYAGNYINKATDSAQSSLALGQAFQEQELFDYAIVCYRQALRLAPNSAAVHKHMGYYYLSRDDKALAMEHLKRSFQLDPYQPDIAAELGRHGIVVRVPRDMEPVAK
jgi:tetratricopeptide (TPR) repeat protein